MSNSAHYSAPCQHGQKVCHWQQKDQQFNTIKNNTMTANQRKIEDMILSAIQHLEEAVECNDESDKEALIDELNNALKKIQETIEHINNQ